MSWLLVGMVLQEGHLVGRLGGGSGLAGFFWRCFRKFFEIPPKVAQVTCWVVWFGDFDGLSNF